MAVAQQRGAKPREKGCARFRIEWNEEVVLEGVSDATQEREHEVAPLRGQLGRRGCEPAATGRSRSRDRHRRRAQRHKRGELGAQEGEQAREAHRLRARQRVPTRAHQRYKRPRAHVTSSGTQYALSSTSKQRETLLQSEPLLLNYRMAP